MKYCKGLLSLLVLLSCTNDVVHSDEIGNNVFGNWLLVETGFSPGGGYVTNEVPREPAQTITFDAEGKFNSTIKGLEEFRYYQMEGDQDIILTIWKTDPSDAPDVNQSFLVEVEGKELTLRQRSCIEGCHMKLEKITDQAQ